LFIGWRATLEESHPRINVQAVPGVQAKGDVKRHVIKCHPGEAGKIMSECQICGRPFNTTWKKKKGNSMELKKSLNWNDHIFVKHVGKDLLL